MNKAFLIAGLIVIAVGFFSALVINEHRSRLLRLTQNWGWFLTPIETQMEVNVRLRELNIYMLFSYITIFVGAVFTILGALLKPERPPEEKRLAEVKPVAGIVYCSSCGTQNTQDAVYCKKCGKKLSTG